MKRALYTLIFLLVVAAAATWITVLNIPHKYADYIHTSISDPFSAGILRDSRGGTFQILTREEFQVSVERGKKVLVLVREDLKFGESKGQILLVIPGYIDRLNYREENGLPVSRVEIIHDYNKFWVERTILSYIQENSEYYEKGTPLNYW